MKKYIFVVLILFVGFNYSFAQPKDVDGWNKTRWGMTEQEVRQVFDGKITTLENTAGYPNYFTPISLDEIEIDGYKYKVDFSFDKKGGRLIKIQLNCKDHNISEFQFSKLEQMLTEKYGLASFKNDDRPKDGGYFKSDHILKRAWNFPSSIIELSYLDARSVNRQLLFIRFMKNIKDNRDNL